MTQKVKYAYEPFAETTDYRTVNGEILGAWIRLIREKGVQGIDRLLDIATGVGTMVQLFLRYLPQGWKQPLVYCLDQSPEALEQARAGLVPFLGKGPKLIHCSIEKVDLPEKSIDVAVWGNGVHYLSPESQEEAFRRVQKILKPEGWFLFNSAFAAESVPAETGVFYRSQTRQAVGLLRDKGVVRAKEERANASYLHPQSYYESLVTKAGFAVEEVRMVAARLYLEAWQHISSFHQYAAGLLRGYPIDLAIQALRDAVEPALKEHGTKDEKGNLYVPRNWLAVAARKD